MDNNDQNSNSLSRRSSRSSSINDDDEEDGELSNSSTFTNSKQLIINENINSNGGSHYSDEDSNSNFNNPNSNHSSSNFHTYQLFDQQNPIKIETGDNRLSSSNSNIESNTYTPLMQSPNIPPLPPQQIVSPSKLLINQNQFNNNSYMSHQYTSFQYPQFPYGYNNINSDSNSDDSSVTNNYSQFKHQRFQNQNVPIEGKRQGAAGSSTTEGVVMNGKYKRRTRTKFSKEQCDILEATFAKTRYPDVNVVDRLALLLELPTERISIWFQNRRARSKRATELEEKRNKEVIFTSSVSAKVAKVLNIEVKDILQHPQIHAQEKIQNFNNNKEINSNHIFSKEENKQLKVEIEKPLLNSYSKDEIFYADKNEKTSLNSTKDSSDEDEETEIKDTNSQAQFQPSTVDESTSSLSRSSSTSTFMPNYYHQTNTSTINNGFPHLIPQTTAPYLPHFYPISSQAPYYSSTMADPYHSNLSYPQPSSNLYSATDNTTQNSFQNIFHQFKQQEYMTNPQNMYYAAAAAAYYNQHYYQQTPSENKIE